MIIKKAEFILSVMNISQIPENRTEIAVAGKSNAGKSSFINFICNNKKLARTAKEPGRTRAINYFDINEGQFSFVDLPGYGFARVSKEEKAKWATLLENYFKSSTGLKHVLLILDIRHNPTEDDMRMLEYLYFYNIAFTIIATKTDKLSKSATYRRKHELAKFLGVGIDNIITVSSLQKTGAEQVFERLEQILSSK